MSESTPPGKFPAAPFLVAGLLLLVTWCVYLPVLEHSFLIYDDNHYVTENSHVVAGLTREAVGWAFTSRYAANWHPLTWISHMLDVELFGLNAGRHHLVNLILHLANAALLFFLVRRATGALWRSAFVAALFAVHPQHVESVAWIAARKDVLSTFFGLLALVGYLRYARKPGVLRYLPVAAAFLCSLMAKPMLVTLPFVLLLLDYWPLGRGRIAATPGAARLGVSPGGASPLALLLEKMPLIVLSAAASAVTIVAQSQYGVVSPFVRHALPLRAAHVAVAYAKYAVRAIWPRDLAVLYPYPDRFPPWWEIGGALLLLSLITQTVLRSRGRRPYLVSGWLWFVGTLVPVIGIVQTGAQEMADRHTYLPLTGLFVIAGWSLKELAGQQRRRIGAAAAAAFLLLGLLGAATVAQVRLWRDDVTLLEHALRVTERNWQAENILGVALLRRDRSEEAVAHLRRAVFYNPGYAKARANLGIALGDAGLPGEGISQLEEALRLNPRDAEAHYNLGIVLAAGRRSDDAVRHYRDAIRIDPSLSDAYTNLAQLLSTRGNFDEAEALLSQALRLNPADHVAHNNLGVIEQLRGRSAAAAAHYRAALALRPDDPDARRNLTSLTP